jgi:uroporphyrinogen III methyltransferase/synthase
VITGHRKADSQDEVACDWQRAAGADTLVFLMGVTALPHIVASLIEVGRAPETPAAVIERGTFATQRTGTATLETVAAAAAQAGLRPPATLVVGEVVTLRERLRWFDLAGARPLLGLRILNTRAPRDNAGFDARLRDLGAEPVSLATTHLSEPWDNIRPLDDAIAAILRGNAGAPAFDWIAFTSAHAVSAFMSRLLLPGQHAARADSRALAGIRLAAVGTATAQALARYGLVADLVPDRATGRHLAEAFGDVAGRRILLPRSDIALRDLPDALAARGAQVTEVVAYVTRSAEPSAASDAILAEGSFDVVTFFSPSAVAGLAALLRGKHLAAALGGAAIACIGETTAAAARDAGLNVEIVADDSTAKGLADALLDWAARREARP